MSCLQYSVYTSGFIILKASLDGALHTVELKSLQERTTHLSHYPYSPVIPDNEVCTTPYLETITGSAWTRTFRTYSTIVQNDAEQEDTIDILDTSGYSFRLLAGICRTGHVGTLPKTSSGNQFVTVMICRYIKLTRAVPVSTTTTSHVALKFMDN